MADDAETAPDMGSLLSMAMGMQQQLLASQEQVSQTVVEGQAGGGVVRIAVTAGMEFRSVTLAPEAVDPDDVEMLQDLVLAALHDAMAQVNELVAGANPMAGIDIGSLDLGGLGAMFGVAGDDAALDVEEVADDDDDGADDPDGTHTAPANG